MGNNHSKRRPCWMSLTFFVTVGFVLFRGWRIRRITFLLEVHAFKKIQIDADGLFVQGFIVYSWLTDPVLGFSLQEHSEQVPKCLISNYLLNQFVVVFLSLQHLVVYVNPISDPYPLDSRHLVRLQVCQKSLAKIFSNVFSVSEMLSLFLLNKLVLLQFFEYVYFFVIRLLFKLVFVVRVVGRSSILRFTRHHLSCSRRQVKGVVVLYGIFLVFVDDLSHFFDCVTLHFAEMVLDFQFSWVFFGGQWQVKVVLIMPIEAPKRELLFSENFFGQDAFFSNHTELIWGVHLVII